MSGLPLIVLVLSALLFQDGTQCEGKSLITQMTDTPTEGEPQSLSALKKSELWTEIFKPAVDMKFSPVDEEDPEQPARFRRHIRRVTPRRHRASRRSFGSRWASLFRDQSARRRRPQPHRPASTSRYNIFSSGRNPFSTSYSSMFKPYLTGSYGSQYGFGSSVTTRQDIEKFVYKYAPYIPLVTGNRKYATPTDGPNPPRSVLNTLLKYCKRYPSLCEEALLEVSTMAPPRSGKGTITPPPKSTSKKNEIKKKAQRNKKKTEYIVPEVEKKYEEKFENPYKPKQGTTTTSTPPSTYSPFNWRAYVFSLHHKPGHYSTTSAPSPTYNPFNWRAYVFSSHHKPGHYSNLLRSLLHSIRGDRRESLYDIIERYIKKYSSFVPLVYDGHHLLNPDASSSPYKPILHKLSRCCRKYPELCGEAIKHTTTAKTPFKNTFTTTTTLSTTSLDPTTTEMRTTSLYPTTSEMLTTSRIDPTTSEMLTTSLDPTTTEMRTSSTPSENIVPFPDGSGEIDEVFIPEVPPAE